MSTLAVIADLHIGCRGVPFGRIVEDRLMLSIDDLFRFLKDELVTDVVFAGDTFDCATVSPRFVKLFVDMLSAYWLKGMRYTFITGNHEFSTAEGNALSYLPNLLCTRVFAPCVSPVHLGGVAAILSVPYMYGKSAESVIMDALLLLGNEASAGVPVPCVMVGHFGVYDKDAPPWKAADKQAVSLDWLVGKLKGTSIKTVVVGHHHAYKLAVFSDILVCQIGALVPRSFSDTGVSYGNVAIIERSGDNVCCGVRHGVVPGVRFVIDDCSSRAHSVGEYTMNTSWYITKADNCAIDCAVVNEPKTLDDVKNGAVTFVDQKSKTYLDDRERPVLEYLQAEEATQAYIDCDKELCKKSGLVSDAVSGIKGDLLTESDTVLKGSYRRLRWMVK